MINRSNYEEYFLLYVDNELDLPVRKAVDEFVSAHPDLARELKMLQDTTLAPESSHFFRDKSSLLKNLSESSIINPTNYLEFFLLYADNELDENQQQQVESFISQHPSFAEELKVLLSTKVTADESIVFPDKSLLYRDEKVKPIIFFSWARVGIAAAILIALGFVLFNVNRKTVQPVIVKNNQKTEQGVTPKSPAMLYKQPEDEKKDQVVIEPVIKKDQSVQQKKKRQIEMTGKDLIAKNVDDLKMDQPQVVNIKNNLPSQALSIDSSNYTVSHINSDVALLAGHDKPVIVDQSMKVNKPDQTDNGSSFALQQVTDQEDGMYMNTVSSGKSKLRGVFRKVSRVFGKATRSDDENRNGVLIGSFQIALK